MEAIVRDHHLLALVVVGLLVAVDNLKILESFSFRLFFLLVFLVLGKNTNLMVFFLYNWNLGQDSRFELSLLFVVSLLLDIVYLEPRVLKEVLCRCSRVIVYIQSPCKDVEILSSDLLVVDVVGSSLYPPVKIIIRLSSEGEAPVQQGEEKHSGGPDISRRARVFNFADNLRSHVRGRPTEHTDLLVVWNASRKAKVNELYVLVFVKENVLELDVSVRNALAVAVLQSNQDLLEDPPCFLFVQLLVDHLL